MIRVLVVAGVRFYRDGIAAALSADPRFDVVGSVADVPEAAAAFASLEPDVVLLDLAGADPAAQVSKLLEASPSACGTRRPPWSESTRSGAWHSKSVSIGWPCTRAR